MNKEKVNKLIDSIDSGLNDIEEDQQPVMQALTEYVRADVRDLKEELNSKPVMPKVFDEWLTGLKKDKAWTDYFILKRLNLIFFENLVGSSNEHKMYYDWLCKNDKKDIKKYQKCVNAVLNGYEVDK
ncbi:hypothetical protein [Companilactobacillus paralimentarius]|uniref:hypothetical protein n=1 Tax=Companilactobacillus paralimentarius TaxID=83526 RepID=UPI00384ACB77